jgi:energy-coupling factor transport system ATP-binding protein
VSEATAPPDRVDDVLLTVADLRVRYRNTGLEALRGVSFDLPRGALAVMMGRAGAGKSTLCQALNGLVGVFLKAEVGGRVAVAGQDLAPDSVARRATQVGLVFQDFESQLFSTRVDLEVAFFPENLGVARDELVQRVTRALQAVHLPDVAARDPMRLSGGQKQRVVIASVLAGEPPLLVLDEPLSDLDPQGRAEVLHALRGAREAGATVLLVENEGEFLADADHILILQEGTLCAWGTPGEVLRDNARLAAAGLRPQPLCDLFERLGLPQRPLTVEEALAAWPASNLTPRVRMAPPAPPHPPELEAAGVRFSYTDGPEVLQGVDFAVPGNEIVALLGQNGCGKSTLAQHFNGLLRARSGTVTVGGRPVEQLSQQEMAGTVGFIFQNPDAQIFAETVLDEVSFAPRRLGLSEDEVRACVVEALRAVDLEGREQDDPFSMARGERQRVAVASVLAARPKILIFDEPTTGLDATQVDQMMGLIARLCSEGRTLLVITHSLEMAARWCHRTAVMKDGRMALTGPTSWVLQQEEALREMGLVSPPVARFARALGVPAVSVEAFVEACR